MLKVGIVGLPNVGKSTLFNAVTRTHKAHVANYPFCTVQPNVGVVTVPDERLARLEALFKTGSMIPTAIEFFDIAGLVAGANRGEGLGNQFLAHIREVDALIHVVRCFEDPDVSHQPGALDPIRDIEIVTTELALADLETVKKRIEKDHKKERAGDKEAIAELALLNRLVPHLNAAKPAGVLDLHEDEPRLMRQFQLLSAKPVIYATNVPEAEIAAADQNPLVQKVAAYVRAHHDAAYVAVSAKIEAELADLSPEEAREFLKDLGVADAGSASLIRAAYTLLGLITFFTHNEKEARAWTVRRGTKAPSAAGVIHSDFEKGFIKAEVVAFEDLMKSGSVHAARDAGRYRLEGRDYEIRDGDVVLFRFNV
ncbi:MAG: redox-regulated ATPase YchF [Verrucomicrobia bacterium RIFCSPLOWO2_12_FULL_64_8]|nr:MAG: redox-regulated ATPase YchF [Verrucomicrobia bacterium RIFCSPLOWO2_12_FULL_64_8]